MKVATKSDAWNEVDKIFPTDYEYDVPRSVSAGYSIYSSTAEGMDAYICDLGDRLEVNLPDGKSINVWIRGYDESDICDALIIMSNAAYQLEDKVSPRLHEAAGLDLILKDIDRAYSLIARITKENYPESRLLKDFGLE